MKVCLLTSNFPPEIHAGTELVASELAKTMRSQGIEVFVVSTSEVLHDGQDVREEDYQGIAVHRVFKKLDEWDQHGLHRPRLLEIVREILDREQPDLVHAHSLGGWGGGQLQQARSLGMATVLTFHDFWVTCPRYFRLPSHESITCPEGGDRDPCAGCVNHVFQHPDLQAVRTALVSRDEEVRREVEAAMFCTAPSVTAASMVNEHLPWQGAIEVIPHGLLREPSDVRSTPPAPGERLRVGTFGNLVEQKGVLELVQAAAGLDCELHFWGAFLVDGFEQQVVQLAVELGVQLVLHGPYDAGSSHPAADLHLAVFPSKCQETYGLVVEEALGHGVPAVVSDQGALAERGSSGGVVVTPLAALGEVLRELVTDRDQLARLRDAVPARLLTLADASDRYREIYANALTMRPSTNPPFEAGS